MYAGTLKKKNEKRSEAKQMFENRWNFLIKCRTTFEAMEPPTQKERKGTASIWL